MLSKLDDAMMNAGRGDDRQPSITSAKSGDAFDVHRAITMSDCQSCLYLFTRSSLLLCRWNDLLTHEYCACYLHEYLLKDEIKQFSGFLSAPSAIAVVTVDLWQIFHCHRTSFAMAVC